MANKDDLLLQIRKLEDFVDSLAATSSNIEEKLHDVSCTLQKIRCWAKTLIGHVPEVLTKAVQDTTTAFLQLPDLTRESTNSTDPLKAILTSAINSYQRTLEITMSSVSPEIVPEVHHPMDATQLLTKCDRLRLEIMNSEEYIHTTRLDKKDKENLWETMSCLRVSVRKLELNITSIESCIHLGRTTADTFNDCMTFLELVHCLTGIPLEIDALKLGLRGFLLEIDTTRSLMQTLHSDTHVGPQQSRQNNGFPKDIRMDDKAVITVKDDSSNGTLGSADIQCCDDSKAVMKQSDYHPQDYQIDESVTKEGHAASYKRAHGSQNRPILLDSDSDIQSRHTNSSTSLSKQASATRQAVEPTSAGRNTLAGSNTHMVHDVLTMSEPGTECTTREIIETIHRIYGIRLDKKQVSRALHSLECVEGRRNGYTVERRSDGRTGFYKHNPTKCNFKTKPIRLLVHDLMLSESGTVDYIQTKFNKKHPKMALSKKKVRTYLKSIACCDSKLENFPTTFYHNQRKCNIATQLLYLHRNSCDGSRLVDCNHPGTCTPDSDSESEYAPSIDIDLEDGNSTSLKGKSACNSASKNQNGLSSLEKAYECDNCTSRYWHERDLRRHKKNLHTQFWSCMSIRDVEAVFIANSTHKNVICGYCGQKFDQLVDQNARIEHVTRTHGFYVCPGKRVFSSDAFQDHLRDVHNGTIGWWTGAFADSVRVEKVGSKRKLTYEHENFQDSSRKGAQKNQFRSDQQREGWTRDDSPVEMNVDNSAIGDNAAEHTDDQADGRQDVNWISRTEDVSINNSGTENLCSVSTMHRKPKPNDYVFVRRQLERKKEYHTWIAKIVNVDDYPSLKVQWAYQPDELPVDVRNQYEFGKKEIVMSFDENDIKADALIGFASVLEGCTDCSISETLCWNRFYDDKQNKIISSPEIKIDSVQRVRYWSEPMTNEMLRILQRKDILNTAIELGGLFPGFEFSRTSVSSKLQRLKRAYKSQKLMSEEQRCLIREVLKKHLLVSEYDSVVEQRKSQRIQQSTQQDASRPRKRVEKTRITRSTRSGGPREAGEKTESDAEIRSDTESISSLNMANDLILESLYPNKTFSLRQRHHK